MLTAALRPWVPVICFTLIWTSLSAGQGEVDLDACKLAGELAGRTAAEKVCEFLEGKCPLPTNVPRSAGSLYPRYLYTEVRKGTCVLLFQTSCKFSLSDEVVNNPKLANCTALLFVGSDPENLSAPEECIDPTSVAKIWDEAVDPICDQSIPPTRVVLPPPVQFQNRRRGNEDEDENEDEGEDLVSEGRPTFQSTTAYNLDSSLAVDGNLKNMAGCTHTGYGTSKSEESTRNPWWSVDLGAKRKITRIVITSRGDCCEDRMKKFEIRIGNYGPLGDGSQDASTLNRICDSGLSMSKGETKEFSCNLEGRYVTIRIPGASRILNLCEVQVFAQADKKIVITNDINLSKGRDTFQSSTLWNGESGRAVDGNRNGIFRMKSCTHTGSNPRWQNTPNPWWAVDLGASKMISAVRITTRSDCCHDRLNGFEIRIGNIKPKGRGDQNSICQSDLNIRRGETYQFSCPMKGRYVSIRIPGHGKILTLCEVEVLG